MTPEDYEQVRISLIFLFVSNNLLSPYQACGIKARKYLESITTDYGPLKTLTVSGEEI